MRGLCARGGPESGRGSVPAGRERRTDRGSGSRERPARPRTRRSRSAAGRRSGSCRACGQARFERSRLGLRATCGPFAPRRSPSSFGPSSSARRRLWGWGRPGRPEWPAVVRAKEPVRPEERSWVRAAAPAGSAAAGGWAAAGDSAAGARAALAAAAGAEPAEQAEGAAPAGAGGRRPPGRSTRRGGPPPAGGGRVGEVAGIPPRGRRRVRARKLALFCRVFPEQLCSVGGSRTGAFRR